jgi:hypothetical protein
VAPALAAVLGGMQAPAHTAGDGLVADVGDALGGQAPAGALGLLLERHQDVLDEGAGPSLELGLRGVSVEPAATISVVMGAWG